MGGKNPASKESAGTMALILIIWYRFKSLDARGGCIFPFTYSPFLYVFTALPIFFFPACLFFSLISYLLFFTQLNVKYALSAQVYEP